MRRQSKLERRATRKETMLNIVQDGKVEIALDSTGKSRNSEKREKKEKQDSDTERFNKTHDKLFEGKIDFN